MLNAFRHLLCSKLCQHNRRVPSLLQEKRLVQRIPLVLDFLQFSEALRQTKLMEQQYNSYIEMLLNIVMF